MRRSLRVPFKTARFGSRYPGFAAEHPEIPWRSMRGMRNRIAHGYFDINFDVVWETARTALPELSRHLDAMRPGGDRGP